MAELEGTMAMGARKGGGGLKELKRLGGGGEARGWL
jgi:hypothetical protein